MDADLKRVVGTARAPTQTAPTPGSETVRLGRQTTWERIFFTRGRFQDRPPRVPTPPRVNGEPHWCEGGHSRGERHRSHPVVVGSRQDYAQVTAWLMERDGDRYVTVNAWTGIGLSAPISLDDAERLRDGLTALIDYAANDR